MLVNVKGSMFDYSVDARVNTVNCVGVMGAGIALAFKNKYPSMFLDYRRACRDKKVKPGLLHIWKDTTGDYVINFPTKRHWKESSRYEDIISGLIALRQHVIDNNLRSLALPALGCGHGGLDWQKVYTLIDKYLGDLTAEIYVFPPAVSHAMGRTAKNALQNALDFNM